MYVTERFALNDLANLTSLSTHHHSSSFKMYDVCVLNAQPHVPLKRSIPFSLSWFVLEVQQVKSSHLKFVVYSLTKRIFECYYLISSHKL